MFNGNAAQFIRQRLQKSGLLNKLLTVGMLLVALSFSLLLFVVVVAGGAVAGGYLWWKTREVRKQIRDRPTGGQIIEGEIVRNFTEYSTAQPGRSAPVTIDQAPKN